MGAVVGDLTLPGAEKSGEAKPVPAPRAPKEALRL